MDKAIPCSSADVLWESSGLGERDAEGLTGIYWACAEAAATGHSFRAGRKTEEAGKS